jgi:hypothetical protein
MGTTTYRVLAGYHRHVTFLCKPGHYFVTVCSEWASAGGFDAVCDDFGNLVRVAA